MVFQSLFPSTKEALESRPRARRSGFEQLMSNVGGAISGAAGAVGGAVQGFNQWAGQTQQSIAQGMKAVVGAGVDELFYASGGDAAPGSGGTGGAQGLAPTESGGAMGPDNTVTYPHDQMIAEAQAKLQAASRSFSLFQALEGETLSPEARAQLDQLREETKIEVGRINEQINNFMRGQDSFQRLSQQHQGIVDTAVSSGKAAVASSRNTVQQNISTIKGEGLSAVEQATGRAMDAAVAALPDVDAQDAYYTYVRGGTVSNEERAKQEAAATESMREIDSLIASNISLNASSESAIANATAAAADAQIDLMGITDRQTRLMTATALDNSLRQSVYNLVTQRQDLERNLARNEQAILNEERTRNEDKFGLAINPTPEGMFMNTLLDEVDAGMSKIGISLNPAQDEALAADIVAWAGMPASDVRRTEITTRWAIALGKDPTEIMQIMNDASSVANHMYSQVSNMEGQTRFAPGSPLLATLIYQGASTSLPPEVAAQYANSPSFHELIRMQSNGRTNNSRGGSMLGIGGLPLETYEAMGINYDDIANDPVAQMEALVLYIQQAYGDPAYALQQYMSTGEFGALDLSGQEAIR